MKVSPEVEAYRLRYGEYGSQPGQLFGCFYIPFKSVELKVIICDAGVDPNDPNYGWDHVSVSLHNRCPNWVEMCFVKDLFWNDDEVVLQFHPNKTSYVNIMPFCLHLWRQVGPNHELPPAVCV